MPITFDQFCQANMMYFDIKRKYEAEKRLPNEDERNRLDKLDAYCDLYLVQRKKERANAVQLRRNTIAAGHPLR
ncbi:hypothetical protein GNF18_07990 [Ligilactobacillus pobuzihii]|uniref:hypothetical protein n=1 Tax=Ligilactobacillus pobuzihii TaxID=449659 RepID=UPI0019D28E37|nr:hypothetical protein [Ligilactobacillus pobuzihii]MBN7275075.1 hypothetical protein [Ligilactobacillus pobuzihii]